MMTKKNALNNAIAALNTTDKTAEIAETIKVLSKMYESLSKTRTMSDEAKAKRKEKTAAARAELMEKVLPILRKGVTSDGVTAKELYETCKDELPADFTTNKVQYILLHEMADEVDRIEAKGKANVYKVRG